MTTGSESHQVVSPTTSGHAPAGRWSDVEEQRKDIEWHRVGRVELLFHSWDRVQRLRHRPPPVDYSGPGWYRLLAIVSKGLEATDVPLLDLGPSLLSGRQDEELWVHATDAHPNEIAHRLAAAEMARFLESEGLLDG